MKRVLAGSILAAAADHFGPDGCVSVTKSSTGTCVLNTDCEGRDTSALEFAFDCRLPGSAVERHSYGPGGFDDVEEYDTGVPCVTCMAPGNQVPVQAASAATTAATTTTEATTTEATTTEATTTQVTTTSTATTTTAHRVANHPRGQHKAQGRRLRAPASDGQVAARDPAAEATALHARGRLHASQRAGAAQGEDVSWHTPAPSAEDVVSYGPKSCVSTWKSKDGHCIMRTKCQDVDTEDFNFGLVCVDNVGRPVRHLFGVNSFESEETFDTLISCDQCLGLTNIPDDVMLNNEVLGLSKEVQELGGMMKNITGTISRLNAVVFPKQAAKAPVALHSATSAPAALHSVTSHHGSERHGHKKRLQHKGHSKHQKHAKRRTRREMREEQEQHEEERQDVLEQEEDLHRTLEMRRERDAVQARQADTASAQAPMDDSSTLPATDGDATLDAQPGLGDVTVNDGFED